jgi:uncharacterized membrane protein
MSTQMILAVSLFFHLLATVVWVGGLVLLTILVTPAIAQTLSEHPALHAFLARLRQRFAMYSNLALLVLLGTGMTQMALDPQYQGFLQIENTWSVVMFAKHLVIAVMVLVGLVLQFAIAPALERISLLVARGKHAAIDDAAWGRLRRTEQRLTWLNAAFGVVVLACSAWAGSL